MNAYRGALRLASIARVIESALCPRGANNGCLWRVGQASLGMHLLALTYLQEKLASPEGVAALDIGCGTGWLLEAFALMSDNSRSNIMGIDLDIEARDVHSSTCVEGPRPKRLEGCDCEREHKLVIQMGRELSL